MFTILDIDIWQWDQTTAHSYSVVEIRLARWWPILESILEFFKIENVIDNDNSSKLFLILPPPKQLFLSVSIIS
jgi:hypothetical protein